jgi:AcrR family transcriptional regulator
MKESSDLKTPMKRKAGTRAGLTKAAIAAAAVKLIETGGMSKFSLRELAKELGVGATTIHAHFRGGVNEISKAIAAAALSGLAPPFKPKQEPDDYLREVLFSILKTLHGRPTVATLVVLQLSSNPVLDPLLAERLLLALAELGVATQERPKMFQRTMGVILEMILSESSRSSSAEQMEASAQMHETIASLSPTEFPNLTELREAIVAETIPAEGSKPSPEVAAAYADRLVATLAVYWKRGGSVKPTSAPARGHALSALVSE